MRKLGFIIVTFLASGATPDCYPLECYPLECYPLECYPLECYPRV